MKALWQYMEDHNAEQDLICALADTWASVEADDIFQRVRNIPVSGEPKAAALSKTELQLIREEFRGQPNESKKCFKEYFHKWQLMSDKHTLSVIHGPFKEVGLEGEFIREVLKYFRTYGPGQVSPVDCWWDVTLILPTQVLAALLCLLSFYIPEQRSLNPARRLQGHHFLCCLTISSVVQLLALAKVQPESLLFIYLSHLCTSSRFTTCSKPFVNPFATTMVCIVSPSHVRTQYG